MFSSRFGLKQKHWLCLFLISIIFLNLSLALLNVSAKSEKVSGSSKNDSINPGESASYEFSNNIMFKISANVYVGFEISYDKNIQNREASMEIKNNKNLTLNIESEPEMKGFGISKDPKELQKGQKQWQYQYGCIFRIQANDSIDKLTLQFKKDSEYDLDPNKEYSLAVYQEGEDSWELMDTEEVEAGDDLYLEASVSDMDASTDYYITIYEVKEDYTWIWILIIIAVSVLAVVIVMSKTDFYDYLKTRHTYIEKGAHRLSLEEVLENENRNKIIEFVLKEPGIHFNELLRKTELAAGNLVWHLDILETYKIIGKKRIGNFIAYFPYYQKNPISNIDLKLSKSKLTLEVLEMIENEPGIYNNLITKRKKVNHKTIQYHIEKLKDLGLVYTKKVGRKNKIYPNLDSDYFNQVSKNPQTTE